MERTGSPPQAARNEVREVVRCIECGAPVKLDQPQHLPVCAKCRQDSWPRSS